MSKGLSTWPVVLLIVLSLVLGGGLTYMYMNTSTVPVQVETPDATSLASDIASQIVIEVPVSDVNNTLLEEIHTEIFLEDNWKQDAKALAVDEYSASHFKDIYNALIANNYTLYDKYDIDRIVVIDDYVSGTDTTDKDADVWQKVKVYFEDISGDDIKVYFEIDTVISDGEVDLQDFTLA